MQIYANVLDILFVLKINFFKNFDQGFLKYSDFYNVACSVFDCWLFKVKVKVKVKLCLELNHDTTPAPQKIRITCKSNFL